MKQLVISEWAKDLVHGCGGFEDLDHYEKVVFEDRDVGIVEFVLESLANPKCKDSQRVIEAILERRNEH